MASGFDIPESNVERGMVIKGNTRDVVFTYDANPIARYTWAHLLAIFFDMFYRNVPVFGIWMFTSKRREVFEQIYKQTLNEFMDMLHNSIGEKFFKG